MTEFREVHFSVGERMGLLLTQIAREHLLYNLNPEKALDALSFGGQCPLEISLALIKGDMVALVDVDTQEFNITRFVEGIHDKLEYEKLDIREWVEKQAKDIFETSLDLKRAIIQWQSAVNYGRVYVRFDYDAILKFIAGDNEDVLDELRYNEEVEGLSMLIQVVKQFIEKSMKIENVIQTLKKWYPEEWKEPIYFKNNNNPREKFYSSYLSYLQEMTAEFNKLLLSGRVDIEDVKDDVQKYVEASLEIAEVIDAGIEPVDIMQNWSAGWLAPNGDYYALNGEIANMLHIQIADALVEKGIIPKGNDTDNIINPDSWLEQQGWVKIHGSNINFAGCLNSMSNKKNVPMTPIQIKKIYEYGALCHNGMLKMGWRLEPLSAIKFKDWYETNPDAVNKKYFEF